MHPRMMHQPFACVQETFPFEHTAEIQKTEQDGSMADLLHDHGSADGQSCWMRRELEMKAVLQIQVDGKHVPGH